MKDKNYNGFEDMISNSKFTEDYFNNKKSQYSLDNKNLKKIYEIKEDYNTNNQTIFRLMDKGYNINEVELIYSARELSKKSPIQPHKSNKKFGEQHPSLKSLSKIYNKFGASGCDDEDLALMAEEIHREVGSNNYNKSIEQILEFSNKIPYNNLNHVLEEFKADRNKKFFSRSKTLDDFF